MFCCRITYVFLLLAVTLCLDKEIHEHIFVLCKHQAYSLFCSYETWTIIKIVTRKTILFCTSSHNKRCTNLQDHTLTKFNRRLLLIILETSVGACKVCTSSCYMNTENMLLVLLKSHNAQIYYSSQRPTIGLLSRASQVRSTPYILIWNQIFISSLLHLCLPNGLFALAFQTKMLYLSYPPSVLHSLSLLKFVLKLSMRYRIKLVFPSHIDWGKRLL
jgi:hypothetical protein